MAHLSLSLLGPFQVTLAGEPVTSFESNKVRGLLAYLVVEADRSHRRESLAGLLWPDWPDRAAHSNLRNALANLRRAIGDRQATPPFLLITRETIQFNSTSNYWLDVTAFTDLTGLGNLSGLEEAVALYRGSFLEGFSLKDSPAFEDWSLLTRERLQRQVLAALHRLAGYYEQRGEYERACEVAWRQVELEPWQEEAHQQLMRLLALSDQRSAALAQYETCRRLLAEELGVEPAAETTRLYEQIRDGMLYDKGTRRRGDKVAFPPYLVSLSPPHLVSPSPFVARERELVQLGRFLDLALAGQGRAVFVTGEAGSGKTALVQEFTRRAQEAHPDLLAVGGNCNAHTGIGDPYLPFREILGLLTGDIEARWTAGTITREHARRLWNTLPLAAQALVEAGPDLIDTFVSGTALVERAVACAPGGVDWLTRLERLVERKAAGPGAPSPQQSDLFEQYTRVLKALARQGPLVLVVDDLQWADAGSINLLFHLGRQLAGSRILIVGAYRPEEVALGRDGKRHPLEPVINEFQRHFGDIAVNLDQAEGRELVEAFLDTEPNRLGLPFREMLYQQTRGHPLFTIELLRGMEERGDLVQDAEGRWVEGPALDWETLPARVEAVIAERVGRLTQPLQDALRAASVEGETFTAEVVARVRVTDEREMVGRLSSELDRRHRLVRAQGILRLDSQPLSRYRFRHILFQRYLYTSLDRVERAQLHEATGNVLEALYGEEVPEIAVQLARHFQEAGVVEKAVGYLHQAGNRAVRLSANEEAIAHFTRGLELLKTLPDTPERVQQELALQLAVGAPLQAIKGYGAPEALCAADRARELCEQIGETPQLLPALFMLANFYHARAEHRKSLELAEQILHVAQRIEDPVQVTLSHMGLGANLLHLGELTLARGHLEQVIAFYDAHQHRALSFLVGHDPGVFCLSWSAWVLWLLGYPDQALRRGQEALALAEELEHPMTLSMAMLVAGSIFHQLRRECQAVQTWAEALIRFSTEQRLLVYQAAATILLGWVQSEEGQVEEGISYIRQGLANVQALGIGMNLTHFLGLLAEGYGKAGQAEEGLCVLAEALAFVEKTGERYYEAELHRLKGKLLLAQGNQAEAEASLHKAVEVARQQSAKSWELRATVSLCRLWQKQGKGEEARQMLAEIYGWFTEGFGTPDLKEAKALLDQSLG
jgi:DNA-binding SARP family transcriptional activator/predicted ATPase